MNDLDGTTPDDEYVLEFDGTGNRSERIGTTVRGGADGVFDTAGYADLLDTTSIDVERIALTESGKIDLFYSCRGISPDALGDDIREAAIQFAALYGGDWDGVVIGLQATGERDNGQPLRWHVEREWAEQCARGQLDPMEYVQRVADTVKLEVM